MVSMEAEESTRHRSTADAGADSGVKPLHPSPHLPQPKPPSGHSDVTHFHLSGHKVVVRIKQHDLHPDGGGDESRPFRGRITFFSRSGCRDSSAVRSFLRDRLLPYAEVNLDVHPSREADLRRRTGGSVSVPQVFLNDRLLGGLVALNEARKSGELERMLSEVVATPCPEGAPEAPAHGADEEEEGEWDEMAAIAGVLRGKVEVRDRIRRVKVVRSCFAGSELVEAVIDHLDCGRKKAVAIGKELARKNFIYNVFRENDFEDGDHLYRFLEHDPAIPKCFNFLNSTNDKEPKNLVVVGQRLTKLMIAILESYASDDRRHLDYNRISISEEFRRYVNMTRELQRADVFELTAEERMTFFLNLYNAMVIHAIICMGPPEGVIERRTFFNDFNYIIGGYPYSLSTIKHGILRSNRRQPYSFTKPFGTEDKRLKLALPEMNSLIHFAMCDAARSSPPVRFFSSDGITWELRQAAREFFQSGGVQVDFAKKTVTLSSIFKWYNADFGQEREILKWTLDFLDARKAGHLSHLLDEGASINVKYQNFDWSLNL